MAETNTEDVKDKTLTTIETTSPATLSDFLLTATGDEGVVFAIESGEAFGSLASGRVTYIASGTVIVSASLREITRHITLFMRTGGAFASSQVVSDWSNSSLGKAASESVDSRIAGLDPALTKPIFTTQDHGAEIYVRNVNFWAADLAQRLTCISPWNSSGGNTRAGTLITPRHIVFAAHYEISENSTIRFITADNQVVTRTMVGRRRHPDYGVLFPDLTVGVLDSDLPPSITHCLVSPGDFEKFMPSILELRVPGLVLDKQENGLVHDLDRLTEQVRYRLSDDPHRALFSEEIIGGDSGNPAFLIIEDQLVLQTVWTLGGGGIGTDTGDFIADLNQMIADVDALAGNGGTGYTLTEVDLSTYPSWEDNGTLRPATLPLPSFTVLPSLDLVTANVGDTITLSYTAQNTDSAVIWWKIDGTTVSGETGLTFAPAVSGQVSAHVRLINAKGAVGRNTDDTPVTYSSNTVFSEADVTFGEADFTFA